MSGAYESTISWDIFEKMGVDAMSPGPRELTLWKTFQELKDRGTIPVVNANITVKEGGAESPIGESWHLFTVNGVKLGVFSLMGGSELATVRAPEGVEFGFRDPTETAAELVPRIAGQADVVVLMSQLSTADTDRLIQAVPGIDVALYGQRALWQQNATVKGRTVCSETSTRGQYHGELVLIVGPDGDVVDHGSFNRALETDVAEKQEILRLVTETAETVKRMREDVRKARESEMQKKMTGERYLGDENCRRCHGEQYRQWESSPHAQAFASLSRPLADKPLEAACVSCHSTGYGNGGFVPHSLNPAQRPSGSPDLAGVQCEACHGQGTRHQRTGKVEVAEAVCRGCHTPEWSPKFDYAQALAAVRH